VVALKPKYLVSPRQATRNFGFRQFLLVLGLGCGIALVLASKLVPQPSPISVWVVLFFTAASGILGWQLLIETKLIEFRPWGAWFPNEFQDAIVQFNRPDWMKHRPPEVRRIEFRSESLFVELDMGPGNIVSIETGWEFVQDITLENVEGKPHVGFRFAHHRIAAFPLSTYSDAIKLMRSLYSEYGFDLLIDPEPFGLQAAELVAIAKPYEQHAWIYINQC